MSYAVDPERRRFFGAAAMTLAATQLDVGALAEAQSATAQGPKPPPIKAATNASFAPLKQIDAGPLNVSYAEAGPADGPAVLLLHGWPYDIHSFVGVTPILASAGYRIIVPYARGYGPTRFVSTTTVRNGEQAALAHDVIDLMDALKIQKPILAGYDWSGRAACVVSALWPERVGALVSITGYNIQNIAAARPQSPAAEYRYWYHWYFHTERGAAGLTQNRRPLCKFLWQL